MRKLITFLIATTFTTLIIANVISPEEMERRKENVLDNFKPTRVHFDGLLESTVVFSKEEYEVGDIIDIKINFKVNTEKNTENMKFAILNYSLRRVLLDYQYTPDRITQKSFEEGLDDIIHNSGPLEFMKCDPDLILGNNNPVGTYHLRFRLKRKVPLLTLFDKKYPYRYNSISMRSFREEKKKKYKFITIYGGGYNSTIPLMIKLDPTALKMD